MTCSCDIQPAYNSTQCNMQHVYCVGLYSYYNPLASCTVCLKSEIHEIHEPPTKSIFAQPKLISEIHLLSQNPLPKKWTCVLSRGCSTDVSCAVMRAYMSRGLRRSAITVRSILSRTSGFVRTYSTVAFLVLPCTGSHANELAHHPGTHIVQRRGCSGARSRVFCRRRLLCGMCNVVWRLWLGWVGTGIHTRFLLITFRMQYCPWT